MGSWRTLGSPLQNTMMNLIDEYRFCLRNRTKEVGADYVRVFRGQSRFRF